MFICAHYKNTSLFDKLATVFAQTEKQTSWKEVFLEKMHNTCSMNE